jgi:hypothetical protein
MGSRFLTAKPARVAREPSLGVLFMLEMNRVLGIVF